MSPGRPPRPDPGDLVRAVHDRLNATAVPRRPTGPPPPRVLPRTRHTQPLPVPPAPTGDLGAVLAARRSAYSFGGQPSLAEVAAVVHHGVGTAPRAGGLPSVQVHLVATHDGPLPSGVHRVDPRLPEPSVAAVRVGDPTAYVRETLDQPPFADRVPLWLALVADAGTTLCSYPPRHYRTLHLDAGAALQGVLLVATALGLRCCPVMGYDDAA